MWYGCETWTVKKAEHWRIDAFELWCRRRPLRVPWTARRSNQTILKEISPGISLEGTMLKLKLQYFGHLMGRADSLEKTLMLGGIGDGRRTTKDEMTGWHHWPNGCDSEWAPGVGDGQGGLACCGSWGCKESDSTEQLNWTELKTVYMPTPCWLKPLCSIRALVPVSLFLSLSLSLFLFFRLIPWSAEALWVHFPAWASKTLSRRRSVTLPHREGAWGLCEQRKPCAGALLAFRVNQGISASFSLLYFLIGWLWTTRFWSIKGL